jgi:putative heme-binding domain-containing protein
MSRTVALLSLALALPTLADTRLVRETEALSPTEEQRKLHVPDGFEIQLFASEPMINKPINLAFDARGRLWVSSTVEYPYSADKARWSDPQGTHIKDSRDAIKILEDTDGDGRADKVTDFADGLNIPTGVLPWHKPEHHAGCIAFSIPNIWYFADTDGDGKADLREILFGPLGYEKDTHGMCSSFRLGLDGWVYATHGFNNTSTFKRKDGSTLELHSGNVFRFRPDGADVQLWSAGQVNPFGLAWDRYNNLYSADCHSSPVYQLLRGAHYPSFGKPHDGLGFAPVMCQHTHGSTGICGIVYIDGGVWGPEWDDHLFLGNVVTSKINHDHVTFSGSTPKANEQPDFLTSDDPWFRPVDLTLGPDNALYIADFYNRIIGHYEVPLDHPGRDRERGRIWRVVKKDIPSPAADFTSMAPPKIAEELGSPNLTRRHFALREVKRHASQDWLPELAKSFPHNEPYQPKGDQTPENYTLKPWDTEPGDFHHESLAFPPSDLRAAHTLWALSHLGERWTVSNALRSFHTGGVWADNEDQNHPALSMSHALQIIGSYDKLHPWEKWNLSIVFDCRGAIPGRAVTSALLNRPDFLDDDPSWQAWVVEDLIELLHAMIVGVDSDVGVPWNKFGDTKHYIHDPSYIHAMKLLLRDFLSQPGVFTNSDWHSRAEKIGAIHSDWFKEVLSATSSPDVSRRLVTSTDITPAAARQIATYGDTQTVKACIRIVALQKNAKGLRAMHERFQESGRTIPDVFYAALLDVLKALLDKADSANSNPAWTLVPQDKPQPVWSVQPRNKTDGIEAPTLQSMGKGGGAEESRTGILRSRSFSAPARLDFQISGHRGPPQAEPHAKNMVRLVAEDGTILRTAFPPRSDTLQPVSWDLADLTGRNVHLEIVDGDAGKAYAWLGIAVLGRTGFSIKDFVAEDEARQALRSLAPMLPHHAPSQLRDQLAPYLPPSPAPPPAPVSPEQRAALDQFIAARLASFQKAKPDPVIGATLFATHCAACHQIAGQGGLIGPQLDGIGTRGPARLIEDILDPNRNVDAHFRLHLITRKDGTTHTGFLKAEIGQVLILADATGTETRIPKADIKTDQTLPHSLMPPTFDQTLSESDFTDLIGYLLTH